MILVGPIVVHDEDKATGAVTMLNARFPGGMMEAKEAARQAELLILVRRC